MRPRRRAPGLLVGALFVSAAVSVVVAQDDTMQYVIQDESIVFTNVPTPDARPVPGMGDDRGTGASGRRTVALPATIYDRHIDQVAAEYGLSPALIKSVALVESGLDPHAESHAGAQGLMQLMPATARAYGVRDAFDPLDNLRAGARHLRDLLDEFDGDLTLALAAYNAGSGAVRRHNGVPAYRETVDYVRKVHEKLGRKPGALPATGGAEPSRPVRVKTLADGSVLISN